MKMKRVLILSAVIVFAMACFVGPWYILVHYSGKLGQELAKKQGTIETSQRNIERNIEGLPPGWKIQVNNYGEFAFVDDEGWRATITERTYEASKKMAWLIYNAREKAKNETFRDYAEPKVDSREEQK